MEATNPNIIDQLNDRNHAELRRLGLELKARRVAAGLTQDQIIAMAQGQLKQGTLTAIERGGYNAGTRHMIVYARLLGYKITFVPDDRQ